jgi:hypothetical protein
MVTRKFSGCGMDNIGRCHNESKFMKLTDDQQTARSNIAMVQFPIDTTAQEILFYNLDGKSFSHSIQAQLNFELIKSQRCGLPVAGSM